MRFNAMKKNNSVEKIQGIVRYHRNIKGEGLKYARTIIVILPSSYTQATHKRYPVLYMHDGQNIADPKTAFKARDWRIDETVAALSAGKKISEIIIVGIFHSTDRTEEYSDSERGRAYAKFLVEKIKLLVDSTYRTKPQRKHTAILGSSMGALVSMLIVWWYPKKFSMVGCMSPAFWYNDEKILRVLHEYTGTKKNIKIYLDCGGREKELISGYQSMVVLLSRMGYKQGKDLEYHFEKNGVHNERAWAKRAWRPLLFMFGK